MKSSDGTYKYPIKINSQEKGSVFMTAVIQREERDLGER
jgi:hypothetical protein